MIFRLILLLLVCNSVIGQSSDFKPVTKQPNYYSRGLFDHKTGITFVGYSRTLAYIKNHEFFIGFGTMIAMHTLSTGIKLNSNYKPPFFDTAYAVFSIYRVAGMGKNILNMPASGFGFQKKIFANSTLNIGLSVTVRTYSNERPSKISTWPQISLSKTW
jgi:hypothetical protein